MSSVTKVNVPAQSLLASTLANAYFYDAYQVVNTRPDRSPLQIWLDVVNQSPSWIEAAMKLRSILVAPFGLKRGGVVGLDKTKTAADYKVGDQIGIFSIYHLSEQELVMGGDDKHLDFRLSLRKFENNQMVTLSTVVHVHNFLGRAYMFFVTPPHRIIASYMTGKI